MELGQQPSQFNAIQQSPSWCEICEGSYHNVGICGANPECVRFVGNPHKGVGQQNYGKSYPSW